jgi:hypothetical protein
VKTMRNAILAVLLCAAPVARAQEVSVDPVPQAPAIVASPVATPEPSAPAPVAYAPAPAPVTAPAVVEPAAPAPVASAPPAPAQYAPAPVAPAATPVAADVARAQGSAATAAAAAAVASPAPAPTKSLPNVTPARAAPTPAAVAGAPKYLPTCAPIPGYAYVPVAQPPSDDQIVERDQLYDQLDRTEMRLEDMEREPPSLGGSITMMVIGYGTMVVSSMVALAAFSSAEDIQNHPWNSDKDALYYDVNDDKKVDQHDEKHFRNVAYGFTAAAGVGLLMGIASTVRFSTRMTERTAWRNERASLKSQRARLRRELDYGVNVTAQQVQLGVQGHY